MSSRRTKLNEKAMVKLLKAICGAANPLFLRFILPVWRGYEPLVENGALNIDMPYDLESL
eukprot:UN20405